MNADGRASRGMRSVNYKDGDFRGDYEALISMMANSASN